MNRATRNGRRWRCALALGLLLLSAAPLRAQEQQEPDEAAKSSTAAIKQYRAAVALQNRRVYDLASDEWKAFLKEHAQDPLAPKARHYLGVCYFQQQKYAEALAAFEKVAAEHPKFELLGQTLLNLGLAQFNLGQQQQPKMLGAAVQTFQTLLDKFPKGDEAPLALYYRAEALYSLGKKPEALAGYAALLEQFPQHALRAKALYGLGVAQEETGKTAEAGATYDKFLKEFPKSELATEVGMRRGETLLTLGQFEQAANRFAAAAAVDGFRFADYALLRQAVCLYELKKYAEAGKLYAALVSQFADGPYADTATLAAGKCFYLAGDQEQAQSWLAKGRKLEGEPALEAAHWLSRSLLRSGRPKEALNVAEGTLAAAAKSQLLPDLKMDRADALYELPERRGETPALYAALFDKYPKHAVAPQAGYMAAYAALGAGQYDQALARAKAFLKAFPRGELAPDVRYVLAESQLQLQRYDKAAAEYARLLDAAPKRPEAPRWMVRRGLCLYLQKKYPETIEALSAQVKNLKTPELAAEAQFLIGGSQFETKQFPQAVASLTAALAAAPQWRQADETLLALGRAQDAAGDRAAGLATLEKLLQEFPESALRDQAYFRRGEMQYAGGDYPAAAASYEKALAARPDGSLAPYAQFGLGWAYLSQQQYEPAAKAFTALLEKHADHELADRAHYARATARQQLGQFDGAVADARAFLQSKPTGREKSDILYILGLSQSGLKKFAEAAESFQAILKTDPKYAAADKVLYELAWTHLGRDEKKEAADTFARLGKEHPKSSLAAESLYRVGEFQYQNEQYDKSAISYYAAFNKAGKSELGEKAVHKLGWSYFQQKDYDRALQSYRSQIQYHPQGTLAADARAMIGECLYQQEKYQEALPALQEALRHKPSSDDFRILALLHAGQSAAQLKQWEASLKLLEKCATEFPDSAYKNEALYEQGRAKQNLGRTGEAKKLYEQVADATDSVVGARARFMLGELQFAEKDHKEAVRSFFKVAYGYGYPKSPAEYHRWQADATFEAARCLEVLGKLDVAKRLFQEFIERFPKNGKVEAARQKLASLGNDE